MQISLKQVLIFIFSLTLFSSCQKEFSFENKGQPVNSTAVFSLGGSPSSCTGFTLSGNYTAGTALNSNNTVTVAVNVSTIGAYSISTNTVNGISFNKTDSFTSTGSQMVTLIATGTPLASGDFNFAVNNSLGSCSFSISVLPAGPVAVVTLDCAGIAPNGVYTKGVALNSTNTLTVPLTATTAGTYTITSSFNGITFSGSGSIVAGTQTITLAGNGTPVNEGTLPSSVTLGTNTCNYSINFIPGAIPATDYLRCSIDGVATTFNVNLIAKDTAINTINGFSIDGTLSAIANSPSLSLNLSNLLGPISTGTYNFLSLTTPNTIFAYPIYDDSTESWTQTTNNQPGNFTIIVTAINSNRITGTFSGTLYGANGAGPAIKTFANGEFSVPY